MSAGAWVMLIFGVVTFYVLVILPVLERLGAALDHATGFTS